MILAALGLDLRGSSSSLEITSKMLALLVEAAVAFGGEARDMALTFFGSVGRIFCVLTGFFTGCNGRSSPSLGISNTLLLIAGAVVGFGVEARDMALAFFGSVVVAVCVLTDFFTDCTGRASSSIGTSNTLPLVAGAVVGFGVEARDVALAFFDSVVVEVCFLAGFFTAGGGRASLSVGTSNMLALLAEADAAELESEGRETLLSFFGSGGEVLGDLGECDSSLFFSDGFDVVPNS